MTSKNKKTLSHQIIVRRFQTSTKKQQQQHSRKQQTFSPTFVNIYK